MKYSDIHLVHMFFVAPLFIYIGMYGNNLSNNFLSFMMILGLVVFLYHSWKYSKTFGQLGGTNQDTYIGYDSATFADNDLENTFNN